MKRSGHGLQGRARLTLDAGFPALKSQTCVTRRSNKVAHVAHGHITLADYEIHDGTSLEIY